MFLTTLKKLAVAVALIGTVGAVNAATYDLGTLDSSKGVANIQIGSASTEVPLSFNDIFTFKVGTMSTVLAGVVGIDAYGDLSAQYRVGVGAIPTWSAWSASFNVPSDAASGVFSYSQTLSHLTLGQTYWVDVKGSATQGAYSVTLAPVPEPESYAMLLAGLGLMGAIARRRKNHTAV